MKVLVLTSVIICSSSFLGSVFGFFIKNLSQKANSLLTALSAGIMLYASIVGLLLPAIDSEKSFKNIIIACVGIIFGAIIIRIIGKLIPYIEKFIGLEESNNESIKNTLLFVLAVAIHHLPEGIATGVSFGTGEISNVITVTSGIAIQNFPEGMIIIPPMLAIGMKKGKILIVALFSSLIEAVGVFIGYLLVNVSKAVLPFILAVAGGTILYVVLENMIPEIKKDLKTDIPSIFALLGFCTMSIIDSVL